MKLTLKRLAGTIAVLLAFSLLAACGTTDQAPAGFTDQGNGVVVGKCSQQFWPTTKLTATTPLSSRSVYFISGVHLYAVNAGNGSMRWCMSATVQSDSSLADVAVPLLMKGPPAPPDGFSAPTVSNGVVYVCSANLYTYAFSGASGALLWKHNTGFANTSAPTVLSGTVYVGSGSIYALDMRNGAQRWQFATPDVVTSSPLIVNGVLYTGSYGDHVYALDVASGKPIWEYDTGGRVYVDPVVGDGAVFFGSGDDGPTLYAVNATTGKLLWSNNMSVDSSLAVANGVLYVGSNNYLYALNPSNGATLWRSPLATNFNLLVANGVIYAATDSNGMYALAASNGTLLWHNALNPMNAGQTTIPVLMDGELYVETIDEGISPSTAILHALNASSGHEDWYDTVSWNISSIGVTV